MSEVPAPRGPEAIQGDLQALKELRTDVEGPDDHDYLQGQELQLQAEAKEAAQENGPSPEVIAVGQRALELASKVAPTEQTITVDSHGLVMTERDVEDVRAGVTDVRK